LPDEVYHRAEHLAQLTSRDVADILAYTIELSLAPAGSPPEAVRPLTELADEEVLALSELQIEPAQDRRLSELLDKQQAGELSAAEHEELRGLMQTVLRREAPAQITPDLKD
jgi:hypothetical protein